MDRDNDGIYSEDVRSHIIEIAQRLWSGHAAVMVGAGFSRNADKALPASIEFPTWNQLADQFYRKLHGCLPDPGASRYLSPLKLADEVQAAYGRPTLDQMIRVAIPDKEHDPSDIHELLLELPWVDVFTVNYDTLLERACSKVTSRRYDIVVSKEDLVYSTKPRIVKLHGSFPSTRPLTITEEDYRRYPRENSPFVNTVQQSLLENTLCLIGFSGDDPNFLHWIGWVRDNLGKENSPKIYLIGLLSLSVGQRELLEQRNVVPLDLSNSNGIDGGHRSALQTFLQALSNRRPTNPITWRIDLGITTEESKSPTELIRTWKEQRERYPNWVVAPDEARASVLRALQIDGFGDASLRAAKEMMPPTDLMLLYEINWRLERALHPIPDNLIPHYERIIEKYGDSWRSLSGEDPGLENTFRAPNISDALVGMRCRDLSLALLRFYREEGVPDKWKALDARIVAMAEFMSSEQFSRWQHERCLQSLFTFELSELKARVEAWPDNPSLPFWTAKRAGLMAEMGNVVEAHSMLQRALAAIRAKQQLLPVVDDLTWVSQEGHVMALLHQVEAAVSLVRGHISADSWKTFSQRWDDLRAYLCDTSTDLKLFALQLNAPQVPRQEVTRTKGFDIGRETVTYHSSRGFEDTLPGFMFLRYCEDVGMPFALGGLNIVAEQAINAAKLIAPLSPAWAVVSALRSGRKEFADVFFGRDALAKLRTCDVDTFANQYLRLLHGKTANLAIDTCGHPKSLDERLAVMVPEILSRLCTKCGPNVRDMIYSTLHELYKYPCIPFGDGVSNLTKRFVLTMGQQETRARIPDLISFPFPSEGLPWVRDHYYIDPFAVLMHDPYVQANHARIPPEAIARLIDLLRGNVPNERQRACLRLAWLSQEGCLSDAEKMAFGEALWSQTTADGFPAHAPFWKHAFLHLPSQDKTGVRERLKAYILNWKSETIDSQAVAPASVATSGKRPVQITRGNIEWVHVILGATARGRNEDNIDWTEEEAQKLLQTLVVWWNNDKERMHEPAASGFMGDSIAEEFRSRYNWLITILAQIICPRIRGDIAPLIVDQISELIRDLEVHGLHVFRLRAASLHLRTEDYESLMSDLAAALHANVDGKIQNACWAIKDLLQNNEYITCPEVKMLLKLLCLGIQWRRPPMLLVALPIVSQVIHRTPEVYDSEIEQMILSGLNSLIHETDAQTTEPIWELADRLLYREHAAELASTLGAVYRSKGRHLPKALEGWREVCMNPDEFAEVRNCWREPQTTEGD